MDQFPDDFESLSRDQLNQIRLNKELQMHRKYIYDRYILALKQAKEYFIFNIDMYPKRPWTKEAIKIIMEELLRKFNKIISGNITVLGILTESKQIRSINDIDPNCDDYVVYIVNDKK